MHVRPEVTILDAMHRRTFAAAALGALALPRFARASSGTDYVLDKPGKWRPLGEDDLAFAKEFAPDAADRKAFLANLSALLEPLKVHPAYANPMGFEVAAQRGIRGDYREKSPAPIPGDLMVQTFFYYRSNGKTEISGESTCTLFVNVNQLHHLVDLEVVKDEADVLFFPPKQIPWKADDPTLVHWSTGRTVTRRTAPIWIPATKERFLKAWIWTTNQDIHSYGAKAKANTFQQKALDGWGSTLASLSSAEKKAPAFVREDDTRTLVTEQTPKAQPVVNFNPDFFDPKLPRTAMQLLHFPGIATPVGSDAPAIKDLRTMIYKKFDYYAMRDLLA